jgi:hypothetical protein
MLQALRERYYDVLATVYIYNEYQAYTGLERLLVAIRQKFPLETEFIAAVQKHMRDERKHYLMFKRYFQSEGKLPFTVEATYGYVDQFVLLIFGRSIEDLEPAEILEHDDRFFQLCRLIMMTEFRGMQQVATLLRSRLVRRNEKLVRIFRVIQRDEPSHCLPYQHWLRQRGSHTPGFRERFTDMWIHYSLVLLKLPLLFLNPRLARRHAFLDA